MAAAIHAPAAAATVRDGQRHLASLRDGRRVYIDGRRVDDVTSDPAFRNAVLSAAGLYDALAGAAATKLSFVPPGLGSAVSRGWQLPTCHAELVERRQALELWAETHYGFMGRSPDHVASCIGGMYMGLDVFEAYDRRRAAALYDYFHYARAHDLFLTYVIINPQADRSKAASAQADEFLTVGVVDEDAAGLTVRGSKMLGTSAIMANEVLVTCIQPLTPGDERYALSFCVPLDTPGLSLLSRKSYEAAAPSVFDNPLASRFDENDAVLYFDDVKVPWERVFVDRDLAMCQRQFHDTQAHVFQNYQCQIRLTVKLRFLLGIAHRFAEVNGIVALPAVRERLGELAAEVAMVEALVKAMEVAGHPHGAYFVPDRHTLYAAQVLTQRMYPDLITKIRDLAGGALIMLPSSIDDFAHPLLADLIGRTQASPRVGANDRVKFFKLAWDALGSEFASRHTQYEMFYAGASMVTKAHAYRTRDWDGACALVDRILGSYALDTELAGRRAGASEQEPRA